MFNRVYKNLSQARTKMPFHNIQIILKRKINLEIKDYRDSFNEPHKKKTVLFICGIWRKKICVF